MSNYHDQRGPRYSGQRNNPGRYGQQQRESFNFENKPFFDNKGELNPEWVKKEAQQLSHQLARQKNGMTTSSLRNFYNEFIRIRNLPKNNDAEKRILIRMLVAKVNYKKTTAKVPDDFVKFVSVLVEEINDDLDRFEKACYIMEAIIGYNPKK